MSWVFSSTTKKMLEKSPFSMYNFSCVKASSPNQIGFLLSTGITDCFFQNIFGKVKKPTAILPVCITVNFDLNGKF